MDEKDIAKIQEEIRSIKQQGMYKELQQDVLEAKTLVR